MESAAEIITGVAVEIVIAAVCFAALFLFWVRIFGWPKRVKILSLQHGVLLEGGQPIRAVPPGSYWVGRRRTLVACDARPRPFQIAGEECISSDRLAVRVSLAGEYKVCDPMRFVVESSDSFGKIYVEIRHALHIAVSELASEQFAEGHLPIAERIKELIVPRSEQLGIEMLQLYVWEATPFAWLRPI